ncbi:MAG: IS21 family transposase [Negativicutes bacterium]
MTDYREILRLHNQGISQRTIAASCACSRNTVAKILNRAQELVVSWPIKAEMSNAELQRLFFPPDATPSSRKMPDYEYIHKEMAKSGVTLSLLWNEYCETCRQRNELPLMYSQFCHYYQQFTLKTKVTMHIHRKPGEQLEVDWAGQTTPLFDSVTGEIVNAYVFIGVLSSSQYAYVEAFASQNQECWITAHVNMYKFFGGATRILVPDNLKTGVEKTSWFSPLINKVYHEMAEHYDTAVIPARVRRPKDKPNAEGSVKNVSTWILAALRNQKFFSLTELNASIRDKLLALNSRPFQKKEGSRLSVFLEEEKPMLLPLPAAPYELATWKIATVQFNYHVSVEKMHYSVPHEYIKHKVDVRITQNVIEVFYNTLRICSHPRLRGRIGQYSTVMEHMPEDHQKYVQWNASRFISWGESVGPSTAVAVKAILAAHKVEQQGYRSCMGLLKLADKYSIPRLEAACAKALSYTPRPGYQNIKTILTTGQDQVVVKPASPVPESTAPHGFTRGAGYYGRTSS